MLVSEFIDRTGYRPSADEYAEIEEAYYVFEGDKDQFCRAWVKANPHKAGQLWAAIKEQERLSKVFNNVSEFVRKSKIKADEVRDMYYDDIQVFLKDMTKKTKCKDRKELRTMVYRLAKSSAVWAYWRWEAKDLMWKLENIV